MAKCSSCLSLCLLLLLCSLGLTHVHATDDLCRANGFPKTVALHTTFHGIDVGETNVFSSLRRVFGRVVISAARQPGDTEGAPFPSVTLGKPEDRETLSYRMRAMLNQHEVSVSPFSSSGILLSFQSRLECREVGPCVPAVGRCCRRVWLTTPPPRHLCPHPLPQHSTGSSLACSLLGSF